MLSSQRRKTGRKEEKRNFIRRDYWMNVTKSPSQTMIPSQPCDLGRSARSTRQQLLDQWKIDMQPL